MDYIPLYPYHDDPFRILSPRRIREELPATPPPEPDPPPAAEGDHPQGGGGARSENPDADPPRHREGARPQGGGGARSGIPDAAYWPNHPNSPQPQDGRGARSHDPAAAPPDDPTAPLHPDPADRGPPPRTGEDAGAERIRLMRAWINKHWDLVEAMARADETPRRPPPPPGPDGVEPPPPRPPVHVRRGDRWTKPKMVDFLRQLAATQSVSAAARSVGMSRNSAYRLRNRLKGQPFDIAWEAAFRHGYDNLAHAALDRALNGVEVPHYCNGKLVGTSRKYDERLTVGLLAMRNRVGAPMLGRFGAAAEYYTEKWDQLLERVGTGPVDWNQERQALGEDELKRLQLPDAEREIALLIARNVPDERGGGHGG